MHAQEGTCTPGGHLLERSGIQHPIQYQQSELLACGAYSLASALHNVRYFNQ